MLFLGKLSQFVVFRHHTTLINRELELFRNKCSWKGQLKKTRSWKLLIWKVRNKIEKYEVGKFEPNLDNF